MSDHSTQPLIHAKMPCCDYRDHGGNGCACPEHPQSDMHPFGWPDSSLVRLAVRGMTDTVEERTLTDGLVLDQDLQEYRKLARGDQARNWKDKPHRLVYDLVMLCQLARNSRHPSGAPELIPVIPREEWKDHEYDDDPVKSGILNDLSRCGMRLRTLGHSYAWLDANARHLIAEELSPRIHEMIEDAKLAVLEEMNEIQL